MPMTPGLPETHMVDFCFRGIMGEHHTVGCSHQQAVALSPREAEVLKLARALDEWKNAGAPAESVAELLFALFGGAAPSPDPNKKGS